MSDIHVVPIDDLIDHPHDDECPCGPTPQMVRRDNGSIGWFLVHHSLDGRENDE